MRPGECRPGHTHTSHTLTHTFNVHFFHFFDIKSAISNRHERNDGQTGTTEGRTSGNRQKPRHGACQYATKTTTFRQEAESQSRRCWTLSRAFANNKQWPTTWPHMAIFTSQHCVCASVYVYVYVYV